jgi:hypothetical protein
MTVLVNAKPTKGVRGVRSFRLENLRQDPSSRSPFPLPTLKLFWPPEPLMSSDNMAGKASLPSQRAASRKEFSAKIRFMECRQI